MDAVIDPSRFARQLVPTAVVLAGLIWSSATMANPVDRWSAQIAEASLRFHIPGSWIRNVMRAESGGKPLVHGQPVVSRVGAVGLMQLMPATWRDMHDLLGLGPDPTDPADNILAGAAYLKLMYARFGYPGLFAAYNAGPARYNAFVSGAHRLPAETRRYVTAIVQRLAPASTWTSPVARELFVAAKSDQGQAIPALVPRPQAMFVVPVSPSPR